MAKVTDIKLLNKETVPTLIITDLVEGEAGRPTSRIGLYEIKLNEKTILGKINGCWNFTIP